MSGAPASGYLFSWDGAEMAEHNGRRAAAVVNDADLSAEEKLEVLALSLECAQTALVALVLMHSQDWDASLDMSDKARAATQAYLVNYAKAMIEADHEIHGGARRG